MTAPVVSPLAFSPLRPSIYIVRYIARQIRGRFLHLYVHVPFCTRRCSYCDFAIAVRRVVPVADFVGGIAAELRIRTEGRPVTPFETIYLGGGTPSKLGSDGVGRLLDAIRATPGVTILDGAELTMEANPEDVTDEAASAWFEAGINRVSLGVQSFDAAALGWMHRTHDASAPARAVEAARAAGIENISMDLIFALPDSLRRDFDADLSTLLALDPDHISLYGLTVEPRTPLGRWTARGEVAATPEDRYAAEFLRAHDVVSRAGFAHYEVSNFARAGKVSRHNSAYWRRAPYLGVGPSAHSFDGVMRRWNEREYAAWRGKVASGADPLVGSEELTRENVLAEEVYLGLRTTDGLPITAADEHSLAAWERSGWATRRNDRMTLTAEGWLRLDSLAASLTALRSGR